jgi:hypothetical protein
MLRVRASGVRAKTTAESAWLAMLIEVFSPVRMYASPSRRDRGLRFAASKPPPGP